MKELLTGKGWIISHECHCGGVHRIEYVVISLPGLLIKTYPKRGTWRAIRKSRKIGTGTASELEKFVNELT